MRKVGITILGAGLCLAGVVLASRARPETPARIRARQPAEVPRGISELPAVDPIRSSPASSDREPLPSTSRSIEELNALQDSFTSRLRTGEMTTQEILDRIRSESEPYMLAVLLGALESSSDRPPEFVRFFLDLLNDPRSTERRFFAVDFLAGASDPSGEVRQSLLAVARTETNPDLRTAAITAFQLYLSRNPSSAFAVNNELLALASDSDVRAVSLQAIRLSEADEVTVRKVASFSLDDALEVRIAVYDRLAEVAPAHRGVALHALEEAFARETQESGLRWIAKAVVRAGRADALPLLKRMLPRTEALREDILASIQAIESGETDLERVLWPD